MKTWLLILFLAGNSNHQNYVIDLKFDTFEECVKNSQIISKAIKDGGDRRRVRSHLCIELYR